MVLLFQAWSRIYFSYLPITKLQFILKGWASKTFPRVSPASLFKQIATQRNFQFPPADFLLKLFLLLFGRREIKFQNFPSLKTGNSAKILRQALRLNQHWSKHDQSYTHIPRLQFSLNFLFANLITQLITNTTALKHLNRFLRSGLPCSSIKSLFLINSCDFFVNFKCEIEKLSSTQQFGWKSMSLSIHFFRFRFLTILFLEPASS